MKFHPAGIILSPQDDVDDADVALELVQEVVSAEFPQFSFDAVHKLRCMVKDSWQSVANSSRISSGHTHIPAEGIDSDAQVKV